MKFGKTAVLLIVGLSLAACEKRKDSGPPVARAVPVEVAMVESRTVPIQRQTIGAVEPLASVQLKSKVQGEIVQMHFIDGAVVKAGEVLFSIDPRPYDAALKRAEANLAEAQAGSDNAKEQADRYTTLTTRGVASKEQFSQYRTTALSLASEVASKQADLEEAQLSKEWTSVIAPIAGRTGAALIKAGNIVQANNEVLVVINQTKPIYVKFSLPEADLADVRQRLSDGKLIVTAFNPENRAVLGEGELVFIDNAVDSAAGMFVLKASFPNDNEALWPGQFVDVTLRLAEQKDALTIPSAAILDSQSGSQVFVVKDGIAELRKIEIARTLAGNSIIRSGLDAGEKVVISGQLRLSAGSKVQIKTLPGSADLPIPES